MSILTRWLLIPPVNARLIGRYRDYRRHGASAFSASAGPGPLSHSNMLVIDRCIAQRNAETAQAGIFRSAKYSWTLPSMDERAA